MRCERCSAETGQGSYDLFDYCATCSRNLCGACMEKGCCGHTPAQAGMGDDQEDETTSRAGGIIDRPTDRDGTCIFITAEESDRWDHDESLKAAVAAQAAAMSGVITICTLGGYIVAAFAHGRPLS